jgi:glycosyltransferase involved in cell wall biosynthesis
MTLGSGMQNKILEAMAVGTPVVSNQLGLGDIRAVAGTDVMRAEGAEGIADAVVCLLKSPERRVTMAENARRFVETQHDWDSINESFEHYMLGLAKRAGKWETTSFDTETNPVRCGGVKPCDT